MQPNCMQTLVASDDLESVPGCWVSGNDGVDLVEEEIRHTLILAGCAYFLRSICLAIPRKRSISSLCRRLRAKSAWIRAISFFGLAGSK